ncbi:F-box protein DOR [Raphanus sativus]|nr:F-box protein DOR [Raphanus sativus]
MNSRRHNVFDDPQTISRRSSRLSADELLLNIPIDLVIEIFSSLPLKSIARCRCVSKRWASVLSRPDLKELFSTKSSARPQLLFACRKENDENNKVIFFSSPQPQNLAENLSPIAVDHHMAFPVESVYGISSPVSGFVCIRDDRMLKARKTSELVSVICDLSTGQCFPLPKMKTRKRAANRSFLGYDPIEKQHKVLAMIQQQNGAEEHQVLTLRGSDKMTWRLIECGIPHYFPGSTSICINGVLYYAAMASPSIGDYMLVCFDVKSEKYSFVKAVKSVSPPRTLVDYKGKLASLMAHPNPYVINGTTTSFEMWILEDPQKHDCSNHVFQLPPRWKYVVAHDVLFFRGVTATNELVLSTDSSSDLHHVYYYNFDKEILTRLEIQGLGALEKGSRVLTFMNHVEDLKLM